MVSVTFRCRRPPAAGGVVPTEGVANLPEYIPGRRRSPLEFAAHVHELQRAPLDRRRSAATTASSSSGLSEHVLYESASDLEQSRGVRGNLELERVQVDTAGGRPLLPQVRGFAQGAVAAARNVREDAIEPVRLGRPDGSRLESG